MYQPSAVEMCLRYLARCRAEEEQRAIFLRPARTIATVVSSMNS
jgi:hypothetical protein